MTIFIIAQLVNLTLTPGQTTAAPVSVLCATKWGRDARHVTAAMKHEVRQRYGVLEQDKSAYEIDHLIPRELGGADTLDNLWPQPWPDAHKKDKEENRLHVAVCAGTVTLDDARTQMRNWGR